ncbi:alpha/beta fold hydrolase [Frigidibacter albus]|uniref:Alpha/beta fold hydrolase n=1 Tax=Frigidibacter albus TaxID=1465486 RepID=A0A6L8VI80_9RHOB|nr:alpha/beta hydrolase [Frigidibacter albus]MZQ88900.1 alpha/beta fold hydrolase [Frigidibacter albus]NBE31043.1 alpha/beta fold hydrolase [Frigidibacter albus]GGH52536.1 hydrolase [Frigidibacter albus]
MRDDLRSAAFVQQFGQGPRPALGIHCSLAHSGTWAPLMAALGGQLTMTAFDLPGHGRSADWEPGLWGGANYLGAATATALELLRQAEGPVDVIGHSFGALVALAAALEAPARVRTLTLIEPVLFAALQDGPHWPVYLAESAPFRTAMQAGDAALAAELFVGLWGNGLPWESVDARQRGNFIRRIGLLAAIAPANEGDSAGLMRQGRLEALAMPVLLIRGDRSPASIPAVMEVLAGRIPGARLEVVAGARHMLPLTHPGEVAALIAGLLSRG